MTEFFPKEMINSHLYNKRPQNLVALMTFCGKGKLTEVTERFPRSMRIWALDKFSSVIQLSRVLCRSRQPN